MRKTVFGCLGAAVVTFALQFTPANVEAAGLFGLAPCDAAACDPCNAAVFSPCDPNGDGCYDGCGPKAGKWFLNGHLEAGFFANAYGQKSYYGVGAASLFGRGADFGSGNTDLLMNTRLTGAQINQVYVSMGRAVDGRHGLDIGGTVDFSWGSDTYMVQAGGLEYLDRNPPGTERWGTGDYFSAFPQAYVEAAFGKWNVKAGKFYTPFGSSHYKSTDNFFYSWDPSALIVPHTAGGAYATYAVNSKLAVFGGWVMPDEIGKSSKNNAVLGGLVWTPSQRFSFRYSFAAGENTDEFGFLPYDIFVQTLGFTANMNKRLKYVFDWTLLNINDKGQATGFHAAAYVLNNEIIYQYNKKWAFGTRFGVFNANDYATNAFPVEAGDWNYVSLGANWTPNKWLTVKPEIRYDWMSDKDAEIFNVYKSAGNDGKHDQFSGGLSAVVKF